MMSGSLTVYLTIAENRRKEATVFQAFLIMARTMLVP